MNTTPLNRETIEAMPAGVALNALVAEHIMGWQVIQEWPAHWKNRLALPRTGPWYLPPDEPLAESKHGWQPDDFSTDIAATWQVVCKQNITLIPYSHGWLAAPTQEVEEMGFGRYVIAEMSGWVFAETAPLAAIRSGLLLALGL